MATEADDRGMERYERLAREKMKRIPRLQGDFNNLEEKHILYGARGTIEKMCQDLLANPVIENYSYEFVS